jgi:class 3 adenylate cyclase
MQFKTNELVALIVVSIMALLANLPDHIIGHLVDRNLLLIALVVTVTISLFLYVKLMLCVTVSILAIGANLPDQFAAQLGISRPAMIVASVVLVVMGLFYKWYYMRPEKQNTGVIEDVKDVPRNFKFDTIKSRTEIINAIFSGNLSALHQLINADVELNFVQNGVSPIFLAIEKGYADIVLMLLTCGVNLEIKNNEGITPIEFAMLRKETRIAEMLEYAANQNIGIKNKTESTVRTTVKTAIMFVDICGTTDLYDDMGNEPAYLVINRAINIITQKVTEFNGTLIKTMGGQIICTFPSVPLATHAACAMHFALEARRPGGDRPIHARIGFHHGEVIQQGNDVFGDTVNIAYRAMAAATARQILTTLVSVKSLPQEFAEKIRPLMRVVFQGKQESFGVYQILWEPESTTVPRSEKSVLVKPQAEERSERWIR